MIIIDGLEMPKTNLMLLVEPDGKVWEMGDLLGDDKLLDGVKAIPAADVESVCLAAMETRAPGMGGGNR